MLKKVIIGVSGGVDSAVSALILKEKGYKVTGIHFKINNNEQDASNKLSLISETLGIPIETIDAQEEFKNTVIAYFRKEHLEGRSPSPCAICNPLFKWKLLIQAANSLGADFVASGHYVQKIKLNEKWFIAKGNDHAKDQSYYLWGLSQDYLRKMVFPLGNRVKTETKEIAKKSGLDFLVEKKESTGLCFTGELNYSELIKKHIPETANIQKGIIVDSGGNEIGKHNGYIFYTIGQKRDLEFYEPSDKCVVGIDAIRNRLTADSPISLWKTDFTVANCNFTDIGYALNCKTLSVKIRGFGWNPAGYCSLEDIENGNFKVKLENPGWAPAPGQPAVFYNEDVLVGGGIIQ